MRGRNTTSNHSKKRCLFYFKELFVTKHNIEGRSTLQYPWKLLNFNDFMDATSSKFFILHDCDVKSEKVCKQTWAMEIEIATLSTQKYAMHFLAIGALSGVRTIMKYYLELSFKHKYSVDGRVRGGPLDLVKTKATYQEEEFYLPTNRTYSTGEILTFDFELCDNMQEVSSLKVSRINLKETYADTKAVEVFGQADTYVDFTPVEVFGTGDSVTYLASKLDVQFVQTDCGAQFSMYLHSDVFQSREPIAYTITYYLQVTTNAPERRNLNEAERMQVPDLEYETLIVVESDTCKTSELTLLDVNITAEALPGEWTVIPCPETEDSFEIECTEFGWDVPEGIQIVCRLPTKERIIVQRQPRVQQEEEGLPKWIIPFGIGICIVCIGGMIYLVGCFNEKGEPEEKNSKSRKGPRKRKTTKHSMMQTKEDIQSGGFQIVEMDNIAPTHKTSRSNGLSTDFLTVPHTGSNGQIEPQRNHVVRKSILRRQSSRKSRQPPRKYLRKSITAHRDRKSLVTRQSLHGTGSRRSYHMEKKQSPPFTKDNYHELFPPERRSMVLFE